MSVENKGEAEGADAPAARMEPLELVSKTRDEVGGYLMKNRDGNDGPPANYDVEQNIREIQAILATNSEILERCMKSGNTSGNFGRCSFDEVVTYTIDSITHFVTYSTSSGKKFDLGPLSKLSPDIDGLFVVAKKEAYSGLIDYEMFFEKSLILHEDVLGPFLAKLKDHLMTVQVCLGKIDEWLMEPEQNTKYLESVFDVKLDPPDRKEDSFHECNCSPGTHPDSLVCGRCDWTFGNHNGQDKKCLDFRSYQEYYFTCKKSRMLKKCATDLPGKFETAFKLEDKKHRVQLERMLDFLTVEDE